MALTGITMFRGRSDVKDLDELIPDRDKLKYAHFSLSDGSLALIYWSRSAAQPPGWAAFLSAIVDPKELRTQSSSAVVAFQRQKTWYLVTFGYGRYLLNLDLVEPSFGLRCTLNGVDAEKIRSIDRKRVDTVSRLTREQLSRDSRMGAFGVDIFQDLLSAVTGVPTVDGLGTRMFGKDAVGLNIDIKPDALGELADLLEDVYGRTTYQAKFPWVDRIGEVSGAKEVDALNKELIRILKKGDSGLDLTPPEIVDWSKAHGYIYRTGEDPEPELTLELYHDRVRSAGSMTLDVLKSDRVQLWDGDGNKLGGWSVYRCITGEITHKGGVYVISDGKWYRIDSDFLAEVDAAVAALATPVLTLPAYNHKSEGDYNKDVAAKSGGALVCMDQEFIWPRSWQDRLEFCDLYSADRKIVHVKRYSGSATLSHLFAQGAVSIRCLLSDLQFLAQLDAKLPPTHGFGGTPPTAASCHVVFAIVAEQRKTLQLPFFSRVSLRNAAEMIHNLGASVSYQEIANHSP